MHLSKNASLYFRENLCGADRDRTDDIQLAKLALSQLSYSPGKIAHGHSTMLVRVTAFLLSREENGGPRWT